MVLQSPASYFQVTWADGRLCVYGLAGSSAVGAVTAAFCPTDPSIASGINWYSWTSKVRLRFNEVCDFFMTEPCKGDR